MRVGKMRLNPTRSLGKSVDEFKYLRLTCKGSSRNGYQAVMFDGEGAVSVKREVHKAQL